MPLTTIDPTAALIVIDLQKGLMGADVAHPLTGIVQRSAELARAFRAQNRPVVLVNVTGRAPGRTEVGRFTTAAAPAPDWADLVAELDAQPGDLLITKQRWGAFHDTTLHADLQRLGVTQVVLTGVSTSAGVETTARAAYEHGYHVVLVTDAMTDTSADAHVNSVELIFPKLGETTTTQAVLAELG
jgi:nicotinamidase-related amidase